MPLDFPDALKMKLLLIALCFAMLCSGCVDPMIQQQQNMAAEQQSRANYVAMLQNRCSTYGYSPGTTEFANCMMAADQANQAANQADFQQRRAIAAGILLRQYSQ